MPPKKRAIVSWSSGKDSCFALHRIREAGEYEVVGLLTTVNAAADRVAMHGVRSRLLRAQSAALDLPLEVLELPDPCTDAVYAELMAGFVADARERGIEAMVFGDLFLADIRAYREERLAGSGIAAVFPLWGSDTRALAAEMLAAGVVATLSCVDTRRVPSALAGRRWDPALLAELPADVDPCGEHGEFHTFVSDGPGFAGPIEIAGGEVVIRGDFAFADLLPG